MQAAELELPDGRPLEVINVHPFTPTGNGLEPTWPNNRRLPPLIAIDHVLADERLGIEDFGVDDLPGTDHRAIFATAFLRSRTAFR